MPCSDIVNTLKVVKEMSTEKQKKTQPKSWELCFIWRMKLRTLARDTTSQTAEGLPPGGKGGARLYRGVCTKGQTVGMSKGYRYLKKTRHLKLRGLLPWLTGIIPLMCTSALWGQCPVLSHPECPRGAPSGWVGSSCSGWRLDGRHPVSILSVLRAHLPGSCNVMAWWL